MKPLHRYLIAAGLVASLGVAAVAQSQTTAPAGGPQPPQQTVGERAADTPKMERRHARMQRKIERKLGKLKEQLQITAAQEAAWTAWTSSVRPGPGMQRPSRDEMAGLSTPERIDRMRAARAQRNAEMDKRLDATSSFYAALTAEQKKVFDAESLRFAQRHRGGRGFHHRG